MALKDSGNVTITLKRSLVAELRAKKKGQETWNDLLLGLSKRARCSIECMSCSEVLETKSIFTTLSELAEANDWTVIYVKNKAVGFLCESCIKPVNED